MTQLHASSKLVTLSANYSTSYSCHGTSTRTPTNLFQDVVIVVVGSVLRKLSTLSFMCLKRITAESRT